MNFVTILYLSCVNRIILLTLFFRILIHLGLDSYNARTVIGALKYLSSSNKITNDSSNAITNENDLVANEEKQAKAILCTIHQPTSVGAFTILNGKFDFPLFL